MQVNNQVRINVELDPAADDETGFLSLRIGRVASMPILSPNDFGSGKPVDVCRDAENQVFLSV
jgi:hypothetical protein